MFGVAFLGLNGSPSLNWTDITGSFDASNTDQTMPFTETLTVSLSNISGGAIYYIKNGGSAVSYSGPFTVAAGDTLHFEAQTKGTWTSVVSVFRASSVLIDTFNITLS